MANQTEYERLNELLDKTKNKDIQDVILKRMDEIRSPVIYIEVFGGLVSEVRSNTPGVKGFIIDHDNLKDGDISDSERTDIEDLIKFTDGLQKNGLLHKVENI